ncbi:MAG: pilus assembly protein PilM [Burkholderiales bacterium]
MLKGNLDSSLDFLSGLLQTKSPPLIGVDISSSSIKMVELAEDGKNGLRLERYHVEPLPKDAVSEGNINNLDAVAEALRVGWKRMGTRVKNLALALPTAAVITKKIIVPAGQREDELEMQVETEANQYIPFALDEVNLDFQVLGVSPSNPDEIEVLIAASRKDKVEDRVAAAEAAGLKAMVMDVESFATQTAFALIERQQLPNGGKDQTIAIVDVGTNLTNVNVVRNDHSLYMREAPFGGNQLTQDICNRYSLSLQEAESAKRTGGLPQGYEAEVLRPFTDNLALEVARALQFFYTSTQYSQVDHIVLCGGCAAIPGINQIVEQRAQVNTLVANPFVGMAQSSRVNPRHLAGDAPSLVVACGLSMRRLDP